jgi:predicted SprT family Zn-dependent metalloprotease
VALTTALLAEHGLEGWAVKVNTRMSRTLGRCDHRTRTIQLARWVFERCPWAEVEDLVRHEVAHALAGARAGHGPRWKALAVELGATPTACVRPSDWSSPSQDRPRTIRLECLSCGHLYPRKNRVKVSRYRCSACGGKLKQYRVAS